MGALEAPQDRHRQDSPDRELQSRTQKGGHGGAGSSEAMAGGLRGRGLISRPGHFSRNPSTPTPPKNIYNSLGHLGGIRNPPGLDTGS